MSAIELVDFASLFAAAPALLLVLDVDDEFTIRGASDAYLTAMHQQRGNVVGHPLFGVLGDAPTLRASLSRVMATKRADMAAIQADDRWSTVNAPVLDPAGDIRWIIHRREDLDERVRDFMAKLLQELRTPLAPLRYGLSVLREQPAGDPSTARVRAVMERQVDSLVRLVDDVLDISRLDSGAFELRHEPVPVAAVIARAAEAVAPRMNAHAHTLEVVQPEEPVWIAGDADRLAHVVVNLLDNAARFTDRGGRITVQVSVADGRAAISVRDSGRGFAPALGAELFDLYRTSDRSAGLGIGLALARRITELHGGTIEAHSDGPGRGAEFVIRLPLAAAPVAVRVLVADDNRDAADMLADILRHVGCEVAVAYDGGEAVELARSFGPTIAFLDIGMPVLDGYEAAKRIRTDAGARAPTLVALTGWGQADDRQRAREAGFDEHLVKPATFEAVRALIPAATR